jgi:hypothetical protein
MKKGRERIRKGEKDSERERKTQKGRERLRKGEKDSERKILKNQVIGVSES